MGDDEVNTSHKNVELDGKLFRVDQIGVPKTRIFCEAWTMANSMTAITVNMNKARDIQRESIRRQRAEHWAAADAAWNIAQESNDAAGMRKAAAHRQALRDPPDHPMVDAAQTPDELAAVNLDVILSS